MRSTAAPYKFVTKDTKLVLIFNVVKHVTDGRLKPEVKYTKLIFYLRGKNLKKKLIQYDEISKFETLLWK